MPEHVRALTSRDVLDVEADLVNRLAARAEQPAIPSRVGHVVAGRDLDHAQQPAVAALAGTGGLLVIEGAAGAGKTTTLAAARELLEMQAHRLVVVTPTLKAVRVAGRQVGADAFSAAWLAHHHGFRWDADGHWTRIDAHPDAQARLLPGDETKARVALVGDRHQLPAVGRGGVLDHAARWAPPDACLALETVHRFADPEYADLSLLMRTGERSGEVFDALVSRGQILVHHSEVERLAALTSAEGLIVADTREQVSVLNAAIRDHRLTRGQTAGTGSITTAAGERLGVGDRFTTRRNDRNLGVANRDTWTINGLGNDGSLTVAGRNGDRSLPVAYVRQHVELAYATTVHGAQGETVDRAQLLLGETTGADTAYVGLTRGREHCTAHLVADNLDEARAQWIEVFGRDRADLGPGRAAAAAEEAIERYGPKAPDHSSVLQAAMLRPVPAPAPQQRGTASPTPSRGISR